MNIFMTTINLNKFINNFIIFDWPNKSKEYLRWVNRRKNGRDKHQMQILIYRYTERHRVKNKKSRIWKTINYLFLTLIKSQQWKQEWRLNRNLGSRNWRNRIKKCLRPRKFLDKELRRKFYHHRHKEKTRSKIMICGASKILYRKFVRGRSSLLSTQRKNKSHCLQF